MGMESSMEALWNIDAKTLQILVLFCEKKYEFDVRRISKYYWLELSKKVMRLCNLWGKVF